MGRKIEIDARNREKADSNSEKEIEKEGRLMENKKRENRKQERKIGKHKLIRDNRKNKGQGKRRKEDRKR